MENYLPKNVLPITAWAEEDKPREKLMHLGKHNLSDAELIAILLGSGSREETAVSLAQRVLAASDNNLNLLGKQTLAELQGFHGIGEAKAVTIAAAMELGRRRQLIDLKDRPQIKSSYDSYNLLAPKIMDLPHEEFWILLLNRACKVIGRKLVSTGGSGATIVDVKMVFQKAVETNAPCLILCHNHPSGNCFPSNEDLKITKKLQEGAKLLDIQILDHIIVADNDYYSFADEGML